MLILSIDTSGKNGSVALARGDGDRFELIATSPVEGGTFSAQLIPQIARLLSENTLKKSDIDAFAAAAGPAAPHRAAERVGAAPQRGAEGRPRGSGLGGRARCELYPPLRCRNIRQAMIRVRDFRAGDIDAVMAIQQHSVTASAWTREH